MSNKYIIPDKFLSKHNQNGYGLCALVCYIEQINNELANKYNCDVSIKLFKLLQCLKKISESPTYGTVPTQDRVARYTEYNFTVEIRTTNTNGSFIWRRLNDGLKIYVLNPLYGINLPTQIVAYSKAYGNQWENHEKPYNIGSYRKISPEDHNLFNDSDYGILGSAPCLPYGGGKVKDQLIEGQPSFACENFCYAVRKTFFSTDIEDIFLPPAQRDGFDFSTEQDFNYIQFKYCVFGRLAERGNGVLPENFWLRLGRNAPQFQIPENAEHRGTNWSGVATDSKFTKCLIRFTKVNRPDEDYLDLNRYLKTLAPNIMSTLEDNDPNKFDANFTADFKQLFSTIQMPISLGCHETPEIPNITPVLDDLCDWRPSETTRCDNIRIDATNAKTEWLSDLEQVKSHIRLNKIVPLIISRLAIYIIEFIKIYRNVSGVHSSILDRIVFDAQAEKYQLLRYLIFDNPLRMPQSLEKLIQTNLANPLGPDGIEIFDFSDLRNNDKDLLKILSILLASNKSTAHEVVVYGYEEISDDKIKLYIQNSWNNTNNSWDRFSIIINTKIEISKTFDREEYKKYFDISDPDVYTRRLSDLLRTIDGQRLAFSYAGEHKTIKTFRKTIEQISPFLVSFYREENFKLVDESSDPCNCCDSSSSSSSSYEPETTQCYYEFNAICSNSEWTIENVAGTNTPKVFGECNVYENLTLNEWVVFSSEVTDSAVYRFMPENAAPCDGSTDPCPDLDEVTLNAYREAAQLELANLTIPPNCENDSTDIPSSSSSSSSSSSEPEIKAGSYTITVYIDNANAEAIKTALDTIAVSGSNGLLNKGWIIVDETSTISQVSETHSYVQLLAEAYNTTFDDCANGFDPGYPGISRITEENATSDPSPCSPLDLCENTLAYALNAISPGVMTRSDSGALDATAVFSVENGSLPANCAYTESWMRAGQA